MTKGQIFSWFYALLFCLEFVMNRRLRYAVTCLVTARQQASSVYFVFSLFSLLSKYLLPSYPIFFVPLFYSCIHKILIYINLFLILICWEVIPLVLSTKSLHAYSVFPIWNRLTTSASFLFVCVISLSLVEKLYIFKQAIKIENIPFGILAFCSTALRAILFTFHCHIMYSIVC